MPINSTQIFENITTYKGFKKADIGDIIGALSQLFDAIESQNPQGVIDALDLLHTDNLDIETLLNGILNNTVNLLDILLVSIATKDFTTLQVSGNFTMSPINIGDESPVIDKQLFAGMSFIVKTNALSATASTFSIGVKYSNDNVNWFTTTTTLNCATDLNGKCTLLTQNTPFRYMKIYIIGNTLGATSVDFIWSVLKI